MPWIGPFGFSGDLCYRFRPNGDDHRSALMEVMLLAPFAGERPASAPEVRLGADDHWRDAVDVLGSLARVFDQDEFNLALIQKGSRPAASPGDPGGTGRAGSVTSATLDSYLNR
jgi:hypothetical protein